MIKGDLNLPEVKRAIFNPALFLLCILCIMWFVPLLPSFSVDRGEDKIKATAAISSLLAPWQIGPLSNMALIYQAKDGYWNCPTSHKSDQWIGLYLRQGRHHSVVAGRGGSQPFKSLSCVSLLMDVACLTSLWPGAVGQGPNLCLTWIIICLHVALTLSFSAVFFSWHAFAVGFSLAPLFLLAPVFLTSWCLSFTFSHISSLLPHTHTNTASSFLFHHFLLLTFIFCSQSMQIEKDHNEGQDKWVLYCQLCIPGFRH